jgi:hypothetical protein
MGAPSGGWRILFRPGDVGASCYILLSAVVQIVQAGIDGEQPITNRGGHDDRTANLGPRPMDEGREVLELRPDGLRTPRFGLERRGTAMPLHRRDAIQPGSVSV